MKLGNYIVDLTQFFCLWQNCPSECKKGKDSYGRECHTCGGNGVISIKKEDNN